MKTQNIVMLGAPGQGKTSLAASLLAYQTKQPMDMKRMGFSKDNAIVQQAVRFHFVNHEKHSFQIIDIPSEEHYDPRSVALAVSCSDIGIVMVSCIDGPMSMTRDHLLMCRQMGLSYIIFFLSFPDMIEDIETLEMIEAELRELVSRYKISSPFCCIRGNAKSVAESGGESRAIKAVIDSICSAGHSGSAISCILQAITLSSRRILAMAWREEKPLKVGDTINLVGYGKAIECNVKDISIEGVKHESLPPGCNGAIDVSGKHIESIEAGMIVGDDVKMTSKINASIFVMPRNEGGRRAPISQGHKSIICGRSGTIEGEIHLPETLKCIMPGDSLPVQYNLQKPMAFSIGDSFCIIEDNITVGVGKVIKICS